jgi:hypothetical protein
MIYKKYSFQSEAQAVALIDALGTFEEEGKVYPSHIHTVVKLGFLPTNVADEETPPTFSDKYSVDVLWRGLKLDEEENPIFPEGWVENELNSLLNYKHNFFGLVFKE